MVCYAIGLIKRACVKPALLILQQTLQQLSQYHTSASMWLSLTFLASLRTLWRGLVASFLKHPKARAPATESRANIPPCTGIWTTGLWTGGVGVGVGGPTGPSYLKTDIAPQPPQARLALPAQGVSQLEAIPVIGSVLPHTHSVCTQKPGQTGREGWRT